MKTSSYIEKKLVRNLYFRDLNILVQMILNRYTPTEWMHRWNTSIRLQIVSYHV